MSITKHNNESLFKMNDMKTLFTLLLLAFTLSLQAQPGTIDKTYGIEKTGIVTVSTRAFMGTSVLQPDNKLLVGGLGYGNTQYLIFRHNPDGSTDTSFGTKGVVITTFDNLIENLSQANGWQAIAVQSDGKIVAAGTASKYKPDTPGDYPLENDVVLARFLPDGTPDESFGNQGRIVTDLGKQETARATAIQSDGKVIVAGYQEQTSNGDFAHILLIRYNTNGTLDGSFGAGKGYVLYTKKLTSNAYALLIQPDNKIVAGGSADVLNSAFLLVRYQPDGSMDESFGNDGEVETSFGAGIPGVTINSLALDENRCIIAAGVVAYSQKGEVVRYLPNGALDNSFGEEGKVELTFKEAPYIYLNTVLAQPDNKLIVFGNIAGGKYTNWTPLLTGLNADGSADSSFGTDNGKTIAEFDFGEEFFNNAVMQQDGKIIIAGNKPYSPNPDNAGYILARYQGYPTRIPLYVRIKRWLKNHGISWKGLPAQDNIAYYSIERSSNSKTGFTQIAKVSGVNHLSNYDLTNSRLLPGTNYYRIKAVSTDGTIRYSEVVSADNTAATASIYPNPVRDYVTVQGLKSNEQAKISIANANGTVLAKGVSGGSTHFKASAANLQPGTYYLSITTNTGKTETLQFVKE